MTTNASHLKDEVNAHVDIDAVKDGVTAIKNFDFQALLMSDQERAQLADSALSVHDLLLEYSLFGNINPGPPFLPQNMYVLPSFSSIYEWWGTLFIHGGIYKKAVIRFLVKLPKTYPIMGGECCPAVDLPGVEAPTVEILQPKGIRHPLVDTKNGRLNIDLVDYSATALVLFPFIKDCFYRRDYLVGCPENKVRDSEFYDRLRTDYAGATEEMGKACSGNYEQCVRDCQGARGSSAGGDPFAFKNHSPDLKPYEFLTKCILERDLSHTEQKHCFTEWFCCNYVNNAFNEGGGGNANN